MPKNLLLTTIGSNDICYQSWVKGNQNFDVGLIYYEDNENYKPYINPNVYFWKYTGFKYPSLYKLLKQNPSLFKYDYIWMPDDDIMATTEDINTLFEWIHEYKLWLAQPSIQDKNCYWKVFVNKPNSIIRYVSTVEVMCPIFSNNTLHRLYNTFNESISGWGLDVIWGKILNYPKDKIAVCDKVIVEHTKPLQENGGLLYEKLKKEYNINPRSEMLKLLKKYNAQLIFKEY